MATACTSSSSVQSLPSIVGERAPELDKGLVWLNTDAPIRVADLAGHVVLLDFWTYGCVNCLHILPDLHALEEHFKGQAFVVLGIHSAKFDAEADAGHIAEAIRRYDIYHPILVDDDSATMRAYEARAWPTTILIDAEGYIRQKRSGEFGYETMLASIQGLLDEAEAEGTLSAEPLDLSKDPNAASKTPLLYPSALSVSPSGALTVSDSGHHRIVIRGEEGADHLIIGSGFRGWVDGDFSEASFARPQGSAWLGDKLYIADSENHVIRMADMSTQGVTTLAGRGVKGVGRHDISEGWLEAKDIDLRSPWALLPLADGEIVVAMAGSHQLFRFAPERGEIRVFSGNGLERLVDGAAEACSYSQPSGLALSEDGERLYVADTEASAIREVDLESGACVTLVGQGLFEFGDRDGIGPDVRLQHPLDLVLLPDGELALSDTYNDRIKRLVPQTQAVSSWYIQPPEFAFSEPRGLVMHASTLYIADTNNQRIIAYELETESSTLVDLTGLRAPLLSGAAEAP